jgi:oligo-1,6-glucosidase
LTIRSDRPRAFAHNQFGWGQDLVVFHGLLLQLADEHFGRLIGKVKDGYEENYLHLFSKKQPDLNWENPQVRAAVYAMMTWWLGRGIDGFRMDVINMISKVAGLPDAPVTTANRYQFGGQYFIHGPRLLEFLGEMKQKVLSRYDILTVGETALATTSHVLELTHEESGALNMVFQFEHMDLEIDRDSALSKWATKPLNLLDLKRVMTRWQKELENGGWNSLYLSNHDQPRPVSRFGDDGLYRIESAKLLATFLHMLQGTPYVYQGEEIGMTNVKFETIDDYRDIETLNMYREFVAEKGLDPQVVMAMIHAQSRDNARTPMQWDAGPQAGFTTGMPWIKVNPNYKAINVKQALANPNSTFYYYQQLIRLRRENPVIVYGRYDLLLDEHPEIYAFTRTWEEDRLLAVLNFSQNRPVFELPGPITFTGKELLISNYAVDPAEDIRRLALKPFEARVYRLW